MWGIVKFREFVKEHLIDENKDEILKDMEVYQSLSEISKELKTELAYKVPYPHVVTLCRADGDFYDICNSPFFWRTKFRRDFKFLPQDLGNKAYHWYREFAILKNLKDGKRPPRWLKETILRVFREVRKDLENGCYPFHEIPKDGKINVKSFWRILNNGNYTSYLTFLDYLWSLTIVGKKKKYPTIDENQFLTQEIENIRNSINEFSSMLWNDENLKWPSGFTEALSKTNPLKDE